MSVLLEDTGSRVGRLSVSGNRNDDHSHPGIETMIIVISEGIVSEMLEGECDTWFLKFSTLL